MVWFQDLFVAVCEAGPALLEAGEIAADYLFVDDPETSLRDLRRQQKGKQYKSLPKAEFLLET